MENDSLRLFYARFASENQPCASHRIAPLTQIVFIGQRNLRCNLVAVALLAAAAVFSRCICSSLSVAFIHFL